MNYLSHEGEPELFTASLPAKKQICRHYQPFEIYELNTFIPVNEEVIQSGILQRKQKDGWRFFEFNG